MPKKKKGGGGMVGLYDVEIMTDKELKQYIAALKKESERLRLVYNEYQIEKRELSILLENTQDNSLNRHEVLIQKEIELQELLKDLNRKQKAEGERNVFIELDSNEQKAKDAFDTFREVYVVNAHNKESEQLSINDLQDREREKHNALLTDSFISGDIHKIAEEEKAYSTEIKIDALSRVAEEHIERYRNDYQNFHYEKKRNLNNILDHAMDKNIQDSSVAAHAEKVTEYFKELFSKNLKASADLKKRVSNLETELNKLNIQLKTAEQEYKRLLAEAELQNVKQKMDAVNKNESIDTKDTELDKIIYENDILTEIHRQVKVEYDIMKNRFISAMRKIYQKADFATFLAEQIFHSLQGSQNKSALINKHENALKFKDEMRADIRKIYNDNEDSGQANTNGQSIRSY